MSYLHFPDDAIRSRTANSITFKINWNPDYTYYYYVAIFPRGSSSGNYYEWDNRLSGGGSFDAIITSSNLTSNTKYWFDGKVYWRDPPANPSWSEGSATAQTQASTYPAEVYNIQANQNGRYLTVSWTQPLGGNSLAIDNYIELNNGNTRVAYDTIRQQPSYASSNRSYTFDVSQLKAGTYYIFIYSNNAATETDGKTSLIYKSTSIKLVTLLKWSWQSQPGSWNAEKVTEATSQQTAYSRVAVSESGHKTTDFYYQVWNDLANWLYYLLDIIDGSISYDISYIKMNSNDKTLTANRWNAMGYLWNLVAQQMGKGQIITTSVKKGDPVSHTIFNTLVDTMNNYIDNM